MPLVPKNPPTSGPCCCTNVYCCEETDEARCEDSMCTVRSEFSESALKYNISNLSPAVGQHFWGIFSPGSPWALKHMRDTDPERTKPCLTHTLLLNTQLEREIILTSNTSPDTPLLLKTTHLEKKKRKNVFVCSAD